MHRRNPRWWHDGYNRFALMCLIPAALLVIGYAQSGSRSEWTNCKVEVRPLLGTDESGKKKSAKRLFCKRDSVIISLKRENQLPNTPDAVLTHGSILSCTYEVVRNKLGLMPEQVDPDTIECVQYNETG